MSDIFNTTILGLIFGTLGTALGGVIGIFQKRKSNKFLSFVLAVASGLMLAVICFSLIPEALEISKVYVTLEGIVIGIIAMICCELFVDKILKNNTKKFRKNSKNFEKNKDENEKNFQKNRLLKTGLIVSIGLALHNIPEGLAIGSGFDLSNTLGFSLAIAICLHDVPEGISMAIPLKNGGLSKIKVMIYVILSGLATGLGAIIGGIIGNISEKIIALSLAFAAGAMLYIVSGELIPEYNKLYNGRLSALGNMLGFIIGLFAMLFL